MGFIVWALYLDQYSVGIWIIKPKEKRLNDFQTKIKTTLCHLFCTQNISLWGWPSVTEGHVTSDVARIFPKGALEGGGGALLTDKFRKRSWIDHSY